MLISKPIRTFFPFAIAVSVAAAAGGSLTELSVHHWYQHLNKPTWTPPDAVFGPVWTVLYGLMALAAWLVFKKAGTWEKAQRPLLFWGIQLILNTFWSGCFFALRRPGIAAIEVVLLVAFVYMTTVAFWRRSRTSGALMIPYCLWSTYAAALNIAIWRMNP